MPSEACEEELNVLSAIFLDDEIQIGPETPKGEAFLSMQLFPATADDKESHYVTLTLELTMPPTYPRVAPQIGFRNPRGLNDALLDVLMIKMLERCEEMMGTMMIYELIDMVKDFLTKNNHPASECPICLHYFTEFDVFYRTKCFHHFHSHCLGKYFKNLLTSEEGEDVCQKFTCPVCRENLTEDIQLDNVVELFNKPPPAEERAEDAVDALKEWQQKQEEMRHLFEKQKIQGGIIDPNEPKQLLVISSPEDRGERTEPNSVTENTPSCSTSTTATNNYSTSATSKDTSKPRDVRGGSLSANQNQRNDRTYHHSKQQKQNRHLNGNRYHSASGGSGGGVGGNHDSFSADNRPATAHQSESASSKMTNTFQDCKPENTQGSGGNSGNSNHRRGNGGGCNRRKNK